MDREIDIITADSAGSFLRWRRRHARPAGSPCANCGTPLRGAWCYQCGQLGEDYHRSTHHILIEAFENFFHADGRLANTVPRLFFDPAGLTNDYLAGKRAPQIPPLRLFLVTLLVLFFVGSGSVQLDQLLPKDDQGNKITFIDQAELDKLHVEFNGTSDNQAATDWLKNHVAAAVKDPRSLIRAMGEEGHRFAFLMLPLSAFLLSIIFVFRRSYNLFDHLIFTMHSLSFQGLLVTVVMGFDQMVGGGFARLLVVMPVHLFFHMRGVYRLSLLGTLFRMFLLATGTLIALVFLAILWVLVGLNAVNE
jgi:hypothetical protein